MDLQQTEMMKAYELLYKAMLLSGWKDLYHKVRLWPEDIRTLNDTTSCLCHVIRTMLMDKVPELYQILK